MKIHLTTTPSQDRRRLLLLSLALFVSTTVLYWPATGFDFLFYDDGPYVKNNPQVNAGLSARGALWAMVSTECQNWHPLTWLSLQLDASLGGLNPGTFHLTNILLHAASSVLLLAALRFLTGATYRSAFVAALFAFHPLHVESVAWIAERKDVLSGLFWMLTLIAYGYYGRRPSFGRYVLLLVSFALGLAAKSMLVTLPCVLLLLDFWPLRRLQFGHAVVGPGASGPEERPAFAPAAVGTLVLEKAPLLALSALASWATYWAQQHGGAMSNTVARLPLDIRCANALVAYLAYLGKMFWPARLAAFYPHSSWQMSIPAAAAAGAALLTITVATFFAARRWPHLLVGWLWYLGTLVPVIGIVQVGEQSMADRYAYLPMIGVWIALVWQAELAIRWTRLPVVLTAAIATACLAGCMFASRRQLPHWRNDTALWRHAIEVTGGNYVAEASLAPLLLAEGDDAGAESHARESVRLFPNTAALLVLGNVELQRGDYAAAELYYREALRLAPNSANAYAAEACNSLGAISALKGDFDAAYQRFVEAAEKKADYATAYNNAGLALLKQGKIAEAQPWFSKSVACDPTFAEAYGNLGDVLFYAEQWQQAKESYRVAAMLQPRALQLRCNLAAALWELKESDEARRQYRAALAIDPEWPERAIEQARQIATEAANPLPEKAVQLAKQACEATDPKTPHRYLEVLAAAYAGAGNFDRAAKMARRALSVVDRNGDSSEAEAIRRRLADYEAGRSPASAGP